LSPRRRLLALLLAGCAVSCGRPEPTPQAAAGQAATAAVPVAEPAVQARFVWQVRCEAASEPCADPNEACAEFVVEYPEFEEGPDEVVLARLNQAVTELATSPSFDDHRAASISGTGKRFLQLYNASKQQMPGYDGRWRDQRKVSVIYQDDAVISFRLDEELYTGGAHGLSTSLLVSYGLEHGDRLSMADLFLEQRAARLNELGEQRLRQEREIAPGRSLSDAGFDFQGDRFRLSSNFAVADQAVLFHYNAYDIAPYALGPTTLVLKAAEIRDCLRPEGPLGRWQASP
jgi:hypothetical protein